MSRNWLSVSDLVRLSGKLADRANLEYDELSAKQKKVAKRDAGFEFLLLRAIDLINDGGKGVLDKALFHDILHTYDPDRSVAAIWTKLDGWKKLAPTPYVHWPKQNRQDISVTKFGLGHMTTVQREASGKRVRIENALRENGFPEYTFPN